MCWPHLTCATDFPSWTVESCPFPKLPADHPIGIYQPEWLDLRNVIKLPSQFFWIIFSGVILNMDKFGLKSGVLYHVTRHNKTVFAFQEENGPVLPYSLPLSKVVLDKGSYGFVSCEKNRDKAKEEAWAWWSTIPVSYITIVLITVGVLMVVMAVVGVIVGVRRRKRSRGNAQFI
ncbi:hypothetical protein Hamer_G018952 [Homarus americanus]|uniref:Uncharacterized protein n=2 Tax=Homarus americanus TaxID=6706 RepID=A0A8J5N078_HOMAM|nr:hypothetical protein Hamer_G018952 [Homarus americanus]